MRKRGKGPQKEEIDPMTTRRDQLITVVEQLSWLCTKEISSSTHMNTVQELGTQHTTAWVFFVSSHYHGLFAPCVYARSLELFHSCS